MALKRGAHTSCSESAEKIKTTQVGRAGGCRVSQGRGWNIWHEECERMKKSSIDCREKENLRIPTI